MKNIRFQNAFAISFAAILFFVFAFAACGSVKTLADNFGANQTAAENSSSEPAPTPNAQQTARCQNILGGDRRNKPNDRGDLPADMPVPRGSVLCGYVDGQRATYYINDAIDKNALAQFYRDKLPPQGFDLQMDNPYEGGGRFMNFGRGASESIQIQTTLSAGAEFRNMFSIAYMPPSDSNGNALTGTKIMRSTAGNSNRAANAPSGNSPNETSGLCRNAYNPVGAELEKKYRVTANGLPTNEMTETYRDITESSFTVHSDFTGGNNSAVKTDLKWACTRDGLTPNEFEGNTLQTRSGVSGKYETLKVSGVSIPNESRWRAGEKWNSSYDVKYSMQFPGSQLNSQAAGTINGAGEILGEEKVTVPAGTFQAMKVRTVMKMNMTAKVNGMSIPVPNQSMETTTWFVKGIGKVKSVNTLGGATVGSTELLSTNAH